MAKKRKDSRSTKETHELYLKIGVSAVIVILFAAVFLYVVPVNIAGQATETVNCKEAPAGLVAWWDGSSDLKDVVKENQLKLRNSKTVSVLDTTSWSDYGFFLADNAKVGKGFKFEEKTANHQSALMTTSMVMPPQFTISLWLKRDALNNDYDHIFGFGYNADATLYASRGNALVFKYFDKVREDDGYKDSNNNLYPYTDLTLGTITLGQWHHVVITYDGQKVRGYVDNSNYNNEGDEVVSEYNKGIQHHDNVLVIGSTYLYNWDPPSQSISVDNDFVGMVDDFAVWNRALSPEEVEDLYNSYSGASKGMCLIEKTCKDNIDNDFDEKTDCKDEDCDGKIGGVVDGKNVVCQAEELTCRDGFDNDANGNMDCDDSACKGSKEVTFGEAKDYSVTFSTDDCPTRKYKIKNGEADVYDNIDLCDTQLYDDQVDVCQTSNNGAKITVKSVQTLGQDMPVVQNKGGLNLTLIYSEPEEGTTREVQVLLTKFLDAGTITLDKNIFAQNMLAGQGLMLKIGFEYYLLSYPGYANKADESLGLNDLKLKRIRDLSRIYESNPYAGKWNQFDIPGEKKIFISFTDDNSQVKITTQAPGEQPGVAEEPANLDKELEVIFTKSTPARVETPDLGLFTICQKDQANDIEVALVCNPDLSAGSDKELITLKEGNLTKIKLGKDENNKEDYFMLYKYKNGVKQVSLFKLFKLTAVEQDLSVYADFITSLIAGRRVAVEFENDAYLLSLAPRDPNVFKLEELSLNAYAEGSLPQPYQASGSSGQVEFGTVKGGKVYLKRQYGTPPPPFRIWAKKAIELGEFDLDKQLFTSFSSTGSVRITTVGVVGPSSEDLSGNLPTFKISFTNGQPVREDQTLRRGEPWVNDVSVSGNLNNILFYYNTLDASGARPIKTVSMYRYYDSEASAESNRQRLFDNAFLNVFVGGNKLALKFGNDYYLLSHEGNNINPQARVYNPESLRLSSLEGNDYSDTLKISNVDDYATAVRFTVEDGTITITTDPNAGTMTFSAKEKAEYTSIGENDYSIVLGSTGKVKIDSLQFDMCNQVTYAASAAADVCYKTAGTTGIDVDIVVNPRSYLKIGDKDYLLEVNGRTGTAKTVTFREVVQIEDDTNTGDQTYPNVYDVWNWTFFGEHLVAGDKPLFNISGRLYSPKASSAGSLADFSLESYPEAELKFNFVQPLNQLSPISWNGMIILNNRIFVVKQEVNNADPRNVYVQASMTLRPYKYLPDDNSKVDLNSSSLLALDFVSTVTGKLHKIEAIETKEFVVKLKIDDLVERYFAVGDEKKMMIDGVSVTIKVESIEETDTVEWTGTEKTYEAVISVRRT